MKISIAELRNNIADTLNRVAYSGERAVLTRRGKPTAVIVPMRDLKLLEWAEDQRWAEMAEQDRIEDEASGEKPVPLEQVKREIMEDRRRRDAERAG